jgi:hypothetical protein
VVALGAFDAFGFTLGLGLGDADALVGVGVGVVADTAGFGVASGVAVGDGAVEIPGGAATTDA